MFWNYYGFIHYILFVIRLPKRLFGSPPSNGEVGEGLRGYPIEKGDEEFLGTYYIQL